MMSQYSLVPKNSLPTEFYPRINLLPWRRHERQKVLKRLMMCGVGILFVGLAMLHWAHAYLDGLIALQTQRQLALKAEIQRFNQKIHQAHGLFLQHRQRIVHTQKIRLILNQQKLSVHLLDELGRIIPPQICLTQLEWKGVKVSLLGIAESSEAISALMQSLELTPWFDAPRLTEIKEINHPGGGLQYPFKLNFSLKELPTDLYSSDLKKPARRERMSQGSVQGVHDR